MIRRKKRTFVQGSPKYFTMIPTSCLRNECLYLLYPTAWSSDINGWLRFIHRYRFCMAVVVSLCGLYSKASSALVYGCSLKLFIYELWVISFQIYEISLVLPNWYSVKYSYFFDIFSCRCICVVVTPLAL